MKRNALQYYIIVLLLLALLLTIIVNIHIPDHNANHNNGKHKALRTREDSEYKNSQYKTISRKYDLDKKNYNIQQQYYNSHSISSINSNNIVSNSNSNSNNIDSNINSINSKSSNDNNNNDINNNNKIINIQNNYSSQQPISISTKGIYNKETLHSSNNELNAQDIISSHPYSKIYTDISNNIKKDDNNKLSNNNAIQIDSLIDKVFFTVSKEEYFSVLRKLYNQGVRKIIDNRMTLKNSIHGKHHNGKTSNENLNLVYVNLFQKALKEGEICHQNSIDDTFTTIIYGIKEIINVASPKLFIELSSYSIGQSLAMEISKSFPSLTNILLQYSMKENKIKDLEVDKIPCQDQNLGNLFISKGVGRNNILGSFDCLQVIDDYSILTTAQLPFEFEEMLGQILCRCNITIVPKALPSTPFFSIWESTSSLLKASIVASSSLSTDSCNIALDTDLKLTNSLTIKRNYYIIQRLANSTHLSTSSGHISSDAIAELQLVDTSKHHILSSVLEHVVSSPLDVESIDTADESNDNVPILSQFMKKFVVSGSKVRSCNDSIEEQEYINKHRLVFPIPEADEVTVLVNETTKSENRTSDIKASRRRLLGTTAAVSNNNKHSLSTTWEFSDEVIGAHLTTFRDINREYLKVLQEIEDGVTEEEKKDEHSSYDKETDTDSSSSTKSITSDSRMRQRALQDREYDAYMRWMSILAADSTSHSIAKSNLVYIFGKYTTLLSAKLSKGLSRRNPRGLLVTVSTNSQSIEPHLLLNDVLKAKNNLICSSSLSELELGSLLGAPEQADVNIVQLDIIVRFLTLSLSRAPLSSIESDSQSASKNNADSIENIFEFNDQPFLLKPTIGNCGIDLFEDMIATILTQSRITYFEIPSIVSITDIVSMLLPGCKDIFSQRYQTVAMLLQKSADNILDARVEMKELRYNEKSRTDYSAITLKVTIDLKSTKKTSKNGVSVYTLLHLGLSKNQKKTLFRLYTELPIWSVQYDDDDSSRSDKVRPWNVFARLSNEGFKNSISLWHYSMYQSQPKSEFGTSLGTSSISSEMRKTKLLWSVLAREFDNNKGELAGEKFSLVEHNSGYGHLSALFARRFPNATVISLENDPKNVEYHLSIIKKFNLLNNAVCATVDDDHTVIKNIYESPELFRFQIINNALLDLFISSSLSEWGENVGMLLSSAVTSFVTIPSAAQVSLAMQVFFSEFGNPYRPIEEILLNLKQDDNDMLHLSSLNSIHGHPMGGYEDFERLWLLGSANVKGGSTQMSIAPISIQLASNGKHIPIVRCDILNMTRHVHHHYNYAKDGHTRTYTMHVQVNDTLTLETQNNFGNKDLSTLYSKQEIKGVQISKSSFFENYIEQQDNEILSLPPGAHPNRNKITVINLERDKDSFPIPYISIYGVTLISVLRIGLENSLRDRLFQSFLKLPLYEDMAPWNVVLMGQSLDYIDYDSREIKFDGDIPKTYLLMAVLMNYKRTVEDFKRCGSKASTVYGLPYVSDCVGSSSLSKTLKCPDMKEPVPCGDGKCHTDYISCLKSLEIEADKLANEDRNEDTKDHLLKTITSAMEYSTGFITENGFIPDNKDKSEINK